jgi:hypothetical protein
VISCSAGTVKLPATAFDFRIKLTADAVPGAGLIYDIAFSL